MAEKRSLHNNCPFVNEPLPGCRVQVITSQTIPQILEFCGDRFTECPLFKNKQADELIGAKNLLSLRNNHATNQ